MDELLDYYSNLLIVQYNGKPKAKATIEMLTKMLYGVNTDTPLFLQIQNGFDWKTAKGKQLDIIGKWVGITRDYKGLLYWGDTFLSYPRSNELVPDDTTDNLQHGYSNYETFNNEGQVLTYNNLGFVEQSLGDDDYKTVIGLKIIKNNIPHTAKNIDDAIWEYFNGQVYTTWSDFTVTYHYEPELTTIMEVCNYKNVLLAPMGVSIVLREI